MKNKHVKPMICSIDDGYKGKFWHRGKLMHIREHLISAPTMDEVCFFGAISVTRNQLRRKSGACSRLSYIRQEQYEAHQKSTE
ncbi:hypothetical protein [Vibrio algicola]|uniref:Uncharacterized protein n=1 Tax=Vibrio algicola TaxID=2662262 RepID=A0A5Q0TK02_9VIBR|nr:hypothetical protein [Vibrio algicola]